MGMFEEGKQPCDNYNPSMDGNGYGKWENVHQCIYCGEDVTVSFCLTCNKDHHQNGYETCCYPKTKTT